MINVLIAEDEPLILNTICSLINSLDSDFIIQARAKNGLEVLQSLNTQSIDVIFTDIKMPMLDGLDLIQEIRNRSLDIPIVIISGYNNFSYAKRALTLGVFDYLLKPIDTEELSNTLERLKHACYQEKQKQYQRFFQQFSIREDFSLPQMALPQIKEMAIIILSAGCYPAYPFHFPLSALSIWKTIHLDKMLKQILPVNTFFGSKPGILENEYFIFLPLNSNDGTFTNLEQQLFLFFRQINIFEYPIHLCYRTCKNDNACIYDTLQNQRNLLMQRVPLHSPLFLGPNEPPMTITIKKYTSSIHNLITLSNKSEPLLAHKIVELITSLYKEQAPAHLIWTILQQLLYYRCLRHNIDNYDSFLQINVDLDEEFTNSRTFPELQSTIENFFSVVPECSLGTSNENEIFNNIEAYILENFRKNISSTDLSKEFGFDSSYLSRQFKLHTGMTPWRFLLDLKLKEAQRLILSHPDMRIKDIAMEIGYNDPLYFSRIFKKYVGVYPSEYKA